MTVVVKRKEIEKKFPEIKFPEKSIQFEFTLNEICNNPWKLKNICLDLGNNEEVYNVTTEYEDKFMSQGMKIYRCEAQKVINTLR